MANLNKVMLIGRLTKDPELRYTPQGIAVCDINIAINYKSKDEKETTTFVFVTAWAKTAEAVAEYCKKGHNIFIEGRLNQESWDDKTTGEKRHKTKVVADFVQFLEHKSKESEGKDGTE